MHRCPASNELEALLSGLLPAAQRRVVEGHVETCGPCQETLARLSDTAELDAWRRGRHGSGHAEGTDSEFLRELPERLPRSEPDGQADPGIKFPEGPTPRGPLGKVGPYHVMRAVGSGATGFVFEAHDEDEDRLVALKVLRPEFASATHGLVRFEREATVGLQHENLVTVHGVGNCPDFSLPFLVLEYVPGETLRDRLQRDGILPGRTAAEIVRQIVLGLDYTHGHGLVHRDLKPSNVLLDEKGNAKLTDFGLARAAEETVELTRSGSLVGTPAYMSPEQVMSPQRVDARSDLYSLGVVLFEMLSGELPFRGSAAWVLHQIKEVEPRSPREFNPRVPRDLETICLKCLAKEPARRFGSAVELAADLERFLDGRPILARPPSYWERGWRWMRRHPRDAGVAALVACSFVALLLGGWWSYYREQQRALEIDKSRAEAVAARDKSEAVQQTAAIGAATRLLRQNRFDEARGALNSPTSRLGWEHHRLDLVTRLTPHPETVLGTHEFAILSLLADEQSNVVVSSGQDGRILVHDTQTNAARELERGVWSSTNRLWCHALCSTDEDLSRVDCYLQLCWVQKGVLLAGASYRGRGVVWDLRDGRRSEVLFHDAPLTAVAARTDGTALLFGDARGTVVAVDRASGQSRRLPLAAGSVVAIAALPSGQWLVAQHQGRLTIVDGACETILRTLDTGDRLWAMDLSPDGKLAATAGATLSFFDLAPAIQRSQEVHLLPEHETLEAKSFHFVRFAPDGRKLAAVDDLGRLMLWSRGERFPSFVRPDQNAQRVVLSLPDVPRFADLPALVRRCSGLVFGSDGKSLLTAGSDTAVKKWSLVRDDAITRFEVGAKPQVRFDVRRPELLWVGDADGTLSVWNSRSGKLFAALPAAHGGAIAALDATRDGLVVTAGLDRQLRFWTLNGDTIGQRGKDIALQEPARSVALSPDGSRVAAYNSADAVALWEVASGHLLGRASLADPAAGPAVGGIVAFNCDGKTLAAVGPGQSSWLLDSRSLAGSPRSIYLAAGAGGTALAWHPNDPGRLVGGDTAGRLCAYPTADSSFYLGGYGPAGVLSLSFSPDGKRLAALRSDRSVSIIDPHLVGQILRIDFTERHATQVLFDPTGERLAVVHRGGQVAIWETQGDPQPIATRMRDWQAKTLIHGSSANKLWLQAQSTALDDRGQLQALFVRRVAGPSGTDRDLQTEVILGRETDRGFQETILDSFPATDGRDGVNSSLALQLAGSDWWAAWRRPRPDTGATTGEIVLARGRQGQRFEREVVAEPDNWGFFLQLLPGTGGKPVLAHFSFDGYYWHATVNDGAGWSTRKIGRQGDGYAPLVAVPAASDSCHALLRTLRLDNDPGRDAYTRLNLQTLQEEERHIIDASCETDPKGAALAPDGSAIVCYTRQGFRNGELIVSRRGPHGWECLYRCPLHGDVSWSFANATCDRMGTVRTAWRDSKGIYLLTGAGNDWRHELVRENTADDLPSSRLFLLNDPARGPAIIETRDTASRAILRILRPATPLP